MKGSIALAAALLMAGCSMEPHYERPAPATPAAWPTGDAYPAPQDAELPTLGYREVFRDPRLLAVIDRALANNQDLRIALANVASARAQYRVARANITPDLDLSGGTSTSRSGSGTANSASGTAGDTVRTRYDVNAGLSAFEIDLFGRLRSLNNSAFDEYLATEATARAARLTLVAEVANAYLTLATDRSLLAAALETQASAGRSVDLTSARLKGGVAPRTDLRQAETVLATAQSDVANLTTLVAQDRNALELLVGAAVADAELPTAIEDIGGLLGEVPAGLDSRILLRRPDVVSAEYRLRAANARIGAARAAFFPTISLTAVAGLASTALSQLFDGNAFTWTIAPQASVNIFDGGANSGNLAFARAQRELTTAQYQQAIQTAFREVADALARRGTIDRQLDAQIRLEAAAQDSYTLADARYRQGVDAFLTALDAQRTLYSARRTLASARLVRASNLVELYRSLGGDMTLDTQTRGEARRAE